ncbi:MAG: hypothetical protein JXN62_10390, partial [Bacteroidales bacterium]|nr:hypothetical protein [Bacteroidales bacterium]
MKIFRKYILILVIIEIIILTAGFILVSNLDVNLLFGEITALSIVFALLAFLILAIVFRGMNKDPDTKTLHIMVALGLKFLIELVFAFLWFFVGKKTGLSSVLLFFVLYLAF